MSEHCYCPICGAKNSSHMTTCIVCTSSLKSTPKKNPVNSSSFRSIPMAIFDIDMTILDNTQRFKDARRGGLVDKEGKAKRKSKLELPGKAYKRRNEFLYSPDNLAKDRVIPGALALVEELARSGVVIAYVTARPSQFYDVTYNQLEKKGFPLFKSQTDEVLLFLKSGGAGTANFKRLIFEKLNAQYDVRMVFDDRADVLVGATSVGIPGVYQSVNDYNKFRKKSETVASNPHTPYHVIEDEEDELLGYDEAGDPIYAGDLPAKNPPVKPRRKKMKNGKYRKEPAKKYVERFMASDKMNKEFPDRGQRYAVCLRYVEKFYGKSGLKSVGARPNPEEYSEDYMVPRDIHRLGKAASRLDDNYEEGQDVPEWWKSKLSVTSKDADTLADSLEYVVDSDIEDNPSLEDTLRELQAEEDARRMGRRGHTRLDEQTYYGRGNPPVDEKLLPIMRGSPTGQYKNLGSVFAEVYIGRSIFKDVGEGIQSIYKGLVGGRTTMTERRMAMAVATMQKELSDRAKALGGNAVANLELDYEIPEAAASVTIIASADAVKMRSPPKANPARKNPANPGKIEKGKKLYKHMNGKDAERIETAKVDMGDVWYQVGEGGCWQIGYMSGKETGSSEQKYTHTFNEESKDGNFPKLYATIPDKGKPMLIIKGGSWKIKTDEHGVAWIYD